jgi:hypothetical protein
MNARRYFPFLLGISFLSSLAAPQQEHPTETPGKLEISKHPLTLERPAGPAPRTLDPAKLRAEANELVKLAQSLPPDINQVAQRKKDIADKLKRMEKLSKHMRGELVP